MTRKYLVMNIFEGVHTQESDKLDICMLYINKNYFKFNRLKSKGGGGFQPSFRTTRDRGKVSRLMTDIASLSTTYDFLELDVLLALKSEDLIVHLPA